MLTRRGFLLSLSSGIAALAGVRYALSSGEGAIVTVLQKRLHYLTLDDAGVHAFAKDLAASKMITVGKLRLAAAAGLLNFEPQSMNLLDTMLRQGEEHIVSTYLLSSDFFLRGADVTQKVSYMGFYDPFAYACRNSFARFTLDADR